MKKSRFSLCRRCGNLVGRIHESGQPLFCCGGEMEALEPNTVEASGEKHLPVVTAEPGAVRVCVGSAAHPMLPEHSIQWIYLQTAKDRPPGFPPAGGLLRKRPEQNRLTGREAVRYNQDNPICKRKCSFPDPGWIDSRKRGGVQG